MDDGRDGKVSGEINRIDMMEFTMFERLLQLPLFQGMTTQEVSDVMSHVRLDFANYHRGDEIVMQGESCRKGRTPQCQPPVPTHRTSARPEGD